jgi:hypothetical protein
MGRIQSRAPVDSGPAWGVHGIAWDYLGSQRICLLQGRIRPKISRLRQTLNGDDPIPPTEILHHENIRVSFLWTTLWNTSGAMRRRTPAMSVSGGKKRPDSL